MIFSTFFIDKKRNVTKVTVSKIYDVLPNTPCRNFSNFFLKTTRLVISVHILVLVSMRKYILNHK